MSEFSRRDALRLAGLGATAALAGCTRGLGVVSQSTGERATRFLARRSSAINRLTGAVMLPVALYYLLVVFDVAGIAPLVEPYFEAVFGAF